jgi:hypothetical protein
MSSQDGLEAAVALVVTELRSPHVEGRRVRGNFSGIGDEDELSVAVDEAANQPRTGSTIDVNPGPDRKSTRLNSSHNR